LSDRSREGGRQKAEGDGANGRWGENEKMRRGEWETMRNEQLTMQNEKFDNLKMARLYFK